VTWGSTIGEIEVLLLGIERSKQGSQTVALRRNIAGLFGGGAAWDVTGERARDLGSFSSRRA